MKRRARRGEGPAAAPATLISAAEVRTARGVLGDAVLVRHGVVAAIGERSELLGPDVTEIRQPDAVIVPGLRDAHFHPIAFTAAVTGLTLDGARSLVDVLAAAGDAAANLAPGAPLIGLRLDDESLAERRLPTAAELSAVVSRPAILHRYCGHVAVANEEALRLAGVDAATPNPPGGVIDRAADGSPTGVLRETAIDLVSEALQERSPGISPAAVAEALGALPALGITSLGAMVRSGDGAWATFGDEAEILAAAAPSVPVWLRCYVIADTPDRFHQAGERLDGAAPHIRWQGLKRFGDGSLGGHTAAMHEPFADRDTTGTLRLGEIDETMTRAALAAGKDVAIHAIGDRACTAVLDMIETVGMPGGPQVVRIEHASVIRAADIARMGRLGVVGSVQPPFLGSETGWVASRVGPRRIGATYPFRSMLDAGVVLAGGSDCPVESPDPWSGMALARDRAGIHPAEALNATEALALYTDGAAAALGEPAPLAVGSPADLVLVDRDPVTATPDELRETRVLATFVAGESIDISAGPPAWPG